MHTQKIHHHPTKNHGFTLVELSIVLAVLGLLAGGIISGKALIHAAQLRAISNEYTRYVIAVKTFREKYFGLPGDIPNATEFWGAATNCPGTHAQPSTDKRTCNGNKDGIINVLSANSNETYRFWQHLSNARLIEGTYSGVTGSALNQQISVIGTNVPPSKYPLGGWSVYPFAPLVEFGDPSTGSALLFDGVYNNTIAIGGQTITSISDDRIIKPEDAWNIDKKMDDGKPGTGFLRTYRNSANCHNAASLTGAAQTTDAVYNVTFTSGGCHLLFTL